MNYQMGFEYSEILKGAKQILAALGDVDAAMSSFGKIDDWSEITKESIKAQKEAIKQLEKEYEALGEVISSMPEGEKKTAAQREYKSIGDELAEEKQNLLDMEDVLKANELSHSRLQTQLRAVTGEMEKLAAAGMQDTDEYRKLAEQANQLQVSIKGVNNQLKPQNMALQAMAGGITTVTGAMSAAAGVITLFGDKNERLNEIMMKMQSLMAITVGLQQVSTNLSKESNVMLGIEALQRAAAAKAAMLQAKGTIAATVAQKAFNVVAKANPYVLLASAIITVVGALVAFTRGTKEAKKQEEELQKQTQESAEAQQKFNDAIASTASDMITSYRKLSIEWKRLSTEQEKSKWIKDNKKAFDELGFSVNGITDAENLLVNQSDAVVEAFTLRAKAAAYASLAAEKYKENIQATIARDAMEKKVIDEYKRKNPNVQEVGITYSPEGIKNLKDNFGVNGWLLAIAQKRVEETSEIGEEMIKKQLELSEEADRILREAGLKSLKTTKENNNNLLEEQKRYLEELSKAEQRAEDLALANLDDTAANKEKKIRTDYGRQIADAEARALSASTPQLAEAYRKQAEELNNAMEIAVKAVYDEEAKKQKEAFDEMLDYYEEYTHSKKKIDEQYQQDLNAATLAYLTASTNEEKKIYADLIKDIGNGRAKNQFDLDMAKVDTTAYATVEEKMDAINKAYATYIDNLVKAGASVEEINAAMREQNELTGKTATLSAQLKDLEATKLSAAESGDTDEVKRINEEIRKLKKQLDDIEKTSDKKTLGTMFKEWAQELKASDLINAGGQLGDVIANIGDAAESKAVAGFGQALSFAGDIGAKIASGDYLGAALSIITEIGNAIAEDIAKVKAFEKANEQAAQTANQINIDNLLGGEDGIFGENTVRQLANYLEALDKARKAISDIGVNSSKSFKVLDRSAFANFFGGSDKFSTLGEFARKNGMELYDAYGNINAQVLDLFKNTYEDLTEADKQWIDNAIAYTDQYAEAMEGLASYLETIFGNTVDTIVDQLFEGAVDMKAIVADVGEAMAKDLMKSAIMSSYFGDLKEQMTDILKAEGGMTDRAAAEIYGLYSEAMAKFENDLPNWQALAEQYKDAFDFGEASSIGAGTALSSASQESIDLLNGQLNAMRTVQGRIDGTINNILLEMRGFRGDVNANHGETLQQLQQINTNTSERGLGRALGAYFG